MIRLLKFVESNSVVNNRLRKNVCDLGVRMLCGVVLLLLLLFVF